MLTLPGGYLLPFGVESAVIREYSPQSAAQDADALQERLQSAVIRAALRHTQAAELLSCSFSYSDSNGLAAVQAKIACREMIARESKIYKSGVDENGGTDDQR